MRLRDEPMGDEAIKWLNDNAGAVQAIATVVLVAVTVVYAWRTHVISKATEKQAEATRLQAEASQVIAEEAKEQRRDVDKPYLLLEIPQLANLEWEDLSAPGDPDPHNAYPKALVCRLHNAGRGPAKQVYVTILQPLARYRALGKDVLMPGISCDLGIEADKFATAFETESPMGFLAWAEEQQVEIDSESAYDCAAVAFCTDIHERRWATFVRFGMVSTTDNVRKRVDSRELFPIDHRIVQLGQASS